ncbi:asparagine synthase (glutamine-hydrolyzing), partial [Vibrio sp. Of7-15]|uniref:asparagine synthase (glutamine-hydrolyzing) n=1 Tax=Vibrio sp. Of7-15 TaxID=2724879 RepID=UPI001EF26EC1
MCGFLTVYSTNPLNQIKPQQVEQGLTAIHHRGPDEGHVWQSYDQRMIMGHTRLSIIGLDNGLQPIHSVDGSIHLVVNGEFYDFEKIRYELTQQGCQFVTQSDSEIALHLYRLYGTKGLEKLRGEFSLVLFDERQNLVIAMRDRAGVKPLFFAEEQGRYYFASEIKAILDAGVGAVWDEASYNTRAFYLNNNTLFKNVKSVPAGHLMTVTPSGASQLCYWDIDYQDADTMQANDISDEEAIKQVHDAIEESVKLRLRADVPIGVYLSGGVDSSAILGMATKLSGKSLDAFNLSFGEMEDYDENRFARLAAEKNGARFHTIPVTQQDLADNFEQAVWHNETPFFNAHGVAKYILSGIVQDAGNKVVLTGEGADEVFGGYPHFKRDMALFNSEQQNPDDINAILSKMKGNQAGYTQKGMPKDVEWLTQQLGHGVSWLDNQAGWFKELQNVYANSQIEKFGDVEPYRIFFNQLDHRKLSKIDPVHRSMYLWAKSFLPNFVLTTLGDRMEMAHSVEGRVPLLDHKVMELAANLPVHLKIRGNTEKFVFREAMKPYLPHELYTRKKHYFRAPPSTLMQQGPLFEMVNDTLNSSSLDNLPFFDSKKVRKLLAD